LPAPLAPRKPTTSSTILPNATRGHNGRIGQADRVPQQNPSKIGRICALTSDCHLIVTTKYLGCWEGLAYRSGERGGAPVRGRRQKECA
jgi:hypothetical protein